MWELWIELIMLTHIHYVHTDFCSFLSLKFSLSYIKKHKVVSQTQQTDISHL